MGIEKKVSREEWIEPSRKLRERVSGHFDPKDLETIDEFIQLAGQSGSFDQVRQ